MVISLYKEAIFSQSICMVLILYFVWVLGINQNFPLYFLK